MMTLDKCKLPFKSLSTFGSIFISLHFGKWTAAVMERCQCWLLSLCSADISAPLCTWFLLGTCFTRVTAYIDVLLGVYWVCYSTFLC